MAPTVETSTPANTPTPIGPYSHVARSGSSITIGGTGGIDPVTGLVAGDDVAAQTLQILKSFDVMLRSVGSDLDHVVHILAFLKDMRDFEEMNVAYVRVMKDHRPARTVVGACELPKPEFKVLMNLTAVAVN